MSRFVCRPYCLKSLHAWLALALLLAACSPAAPAGVVPAPPLTVTPSLTAQALATATWLPVSPTPVVAGPAGRPAAPVSPLADLPTPAPDPLHFTFPTSAAEPLSLWRPPLYPVPWEPTPFDHFYFIRPIGADDVNWPLAKYRYGGQLYSEPHTGIDIPARKGTPILAAGPGTVMFAGWGVYNTGDIYKDPYGIAVLIKHDFGYQGSNLYTLYGHMEKTIVYRGQHVQAGQQIGEVGETGNASGPHLHFEVRIGESNFFVSRNPELWISPPQGWGVLVGRILDNAGNKLAGLKVNVASKEGKGIYQVITYGDGPAINSDPYYQEDLVLGDLPAGEYTVSMEYDGMLRRASMTIVPGLVTYFTYKASTGYSLAAPPTPTPAPSSVPPFPSATPTPTPVTPTPLTPSPTLLPITLTP